MIRPGYEKLHAFLFELPPAKRLLASCRYDAGDCQCVLGVVLGAVPPEYNGDVIANLILEEPRFVTKLRAVGLDDQDATAVQYVCDGYRRQENTPEVARARYDYVMRWLDQTQEVTA